MEEIKEMQEIQESEKRKRGRPRKAIIIQEVKEAKKRGRKPGDKIVFVTNRENSGKYKRLLTPEYRELVKNNCMYKLILDKYKDVIDFSSIDEKEALKYLDK